MGKKIDTIRLFLLPWILLALFPDAVMATQTHGDPEGLFVHQFAHGFFVISLAIFIYWLRFRNLIVETGWRYIQYAAIFLILWNVDATIAHMFDEQVQMIEVERIGHWHLKITSADNTNFTIILYYLVKLDHLLCVPALIFLYAGLKQFLKEPLPSVPSVPEPGHREEMGS